MSKERQGYRHFDLPVDWLEKSGGWVPPKSQDPQEIAELKELPAGSVVLRRQSIGVEVAAHMLNFMATEDTENPGVKVLAAAGLVTAWHNLAENAENRMRKVTHLPVHIDTDGQPTKAGMVTKGSEMMYAAALEATDMSREAERRGSRILRIKNRLGKAVASGSLTVASAPYASLIATYEGDDEAMQSFARQGALTARSQAVDMRTDLGVYPSLAQLSDRFHPLPVHIQTAGPELALTREALDYAQTTVLEQAA